MTRSYYLVNGMKGKGKALKLLVNGKLKRDFKDISTLDIQTLDINRKNAKGILEEYNRGIDLSGSYADIYYPFRTNEKKGYVTIFGSNDEDSKKYLDKLRYYAEVRDYNKENGNKVEIEQDKRFENLVKSLLHNILNMPKGTFTGYESLLAAKLKDVIDERFRRPYTSTDSYINSNIYLIRNILSSYTQLRNLIFMYTSYLEENNGKIRTKTNNAANWDIEDLCPYVEPVEEYRQMTLEDYMDIKPIKKK